MSNEEEVENKKKKGKKYCPTETFYVGPENSRNRAIVEKFKDNMTIRHKKYSPSIIELLNKENQRLAGLDEGEIIMPFNYEAKQDELQKILALEKRLGKQLSDECVGESYSGHNLFWNAKDHLDKVLWMLAKDFGLDDGFYGDIPGFIAYLLGLKNKKEFRCLTSFRRHTMIQYLESVQKRHEAAKELNDYAEKLYKRKNNKDSKSKASDDSTDSKDSA